MFFLIPTSLSVNRPVFFLPGTTGSNLYANLDGTYDAGNFCTKKANHMLLWDNSTLKGTTLQANCLMKYMAEEYDPSTQTSSFHKGVNIYADKINTLGCCFGTTFIRKTFMQYGYTSDDFIIVPFDWSRSIFDHYHPDGVFPILKSAIEKAYNETKYPVAMIGLSMGTLMIHHFLTNFVSAKWRNLYVGKVFFMAPAAAGSPLAYGYLLNRTFNFVPKASTDVVLQNIASIPGMMDLFPNFDVYGDMIFGIDPDGKTYTSRNITTLFSHFNSFSENAANIYKINEPLFKTPLKDIGVETMIYYNSMLDTDTVYDFSNGWDNLVVKTTGGDGAVPAIGPIWMCQNFANVKCVDIKCTEKTCSHAFLMINPDVLDAAYEFVSGRKIKNSIRQVTKNDFKQAMHEIELSRSFSHKIKHNC